MGWSKVIRTDKFFPGLEKREMESSFLVLPSVSVDSPRFLLSLPFLMLVYSPPDIIRPMILISFNFPNCSIGWLSVNRKELSPLPAQTEAEPISPLPPLSRLVSLPQFSRQSSDTSAVVSERESRQQDKTGKRPISRISPRLSWKKFPNFWETLTTNPKNNQLSTPSVCASKILKPSFCPYSHSESPLDLETPPIRRSVVIWLINRRTINYK